MLVDTDANDQDDEYQTVSTHLYIHIKVKSIIATDMNIISTTE